MSLATRVLIGLVAGFGLGLAIAGSTSPAATAIVAVLAPVGTIFVNLIRMTVIPLVVSMLIASVGTTAASGTLGRIGARAAVMAVALLAIAATITVMVGAPIAARIQIDQTAAMALRGPTPPTTAPGAATTSQVSLAQWVIDLVPQNVVKSAADGAMLPVIMFAVLFGFAVSRVADPRRDAVLRVALGIADAMQRLVSAILALAPIGVFALAVPLASKLGLAAAGAVIAYIALVVALTIAIAAILLYPLGIIGGAMSPARFVAFSAPSQAVAFASRSSVAALPAMLESAQRERMPAEITGFLLPLAANVFRVGAAVAQPVGVLFLARLYGVVLSPAQLASVVFTVVLTSFAIPGIPGGSIISMVPVMSAVNLPIEGIGILLAVDTIPDMFRTTANLTGMLTLASVLRKHSY
jgi:Na+/H+-dicarboxylate symporter